MNSLESFLEELKFERQTILTEADKKKKKDKEEEKTPPAAGGEDPLKANTTDAEDNPDNLSDGDPELAEEENVDEPDDLTDGDDPSDDVDDSGIEDEEQPDEPNEEDMVDDPDSLGDGEPTEDSEETPDAGDDPLAGDESDSVDEPESLGDDEPTEDDTPDAGEDGGEDSVDEPDDLGGEPGDEGDDAGGEDSVDEPDDLGGDPGDEGDDTPDAGNGDDSNTSGDQSTPSEVDGKIKELEGEIFEDLSDDQKAIRTKELKDNFIKLYNIIIGFKDKLEYVKKTSDNIKIVTAASYELDKLAVLVSYYITKTFPTKTYIENKADFYYAMWVLNRINDLLGTLVEDEKE